MSRPPPPSGASSRGAGIGLVYGGGNTGLMGASPAPSSPKAAMSPASSRNSCPTGKSRSKPRKDLIVVPDMHTRKQLMFEKADAFVALPGGIGTLEELVEQLTWVQLERHTKPVLLADIGGFWRPLLDLFAHMRERRFIQSNFEVRYLVAEAVDDILPMIETAAERTAKLGRTKTDVDPRL